MSTNSSNEVLKNFKTALLQRKDFQNNFSIYFFQSSYLFFHKVKGTPKLSSELHVTLDAIVSSLKPFAFAEVDFKNWSFEKIKKTMLSLNSLEELSNFLNTFEGLPLNTAIAFPFKSFDPLFISKYKWAKFKNAQISEKKISTTLIELETEHQKILDKLALNEFMVGRILHPTSESILEVTFVVATLE